MQLFEISNEFTSEEQKLKSSMCRRDASQVLVSVILRILNGFHPTCTLFCPDFGILPNLIAAYTYTNLRAVGYMAVASV